MLSVKQLRHFVIRPTLQGIKLWSHAAEQLVLCTGLHESKLEFIDQIDRGDLRIGPAVGIYQMEKSTHDDHWRWLNREGQHQLALEVSRYVASRPPAWEQMMGNLWYATAMCRVHYRRKPAYSDDLALPPGDNLEALASYWKRWYNTAAGKGTVEQFVNSCQKYWRLGL